MISLIFGPMMSSKSTSLLARLERDLIAKRKVILLRPSSDTRGFLTHSGKILEELEERFVEDLKEVDVSDYQVVGIDEGQFHKGLKSFCLRQSRAGKKIYVSALHATSESQMFEEIVNLIPYCDGGITKLNGVCSSCGSDYGNYSFYKAGSKTEKFSVGGLNKYTCLCEKCYFESMLEEK